MLTHPLRNFHLLDADGILGRGRGEVGRHVTHYQKVMGSSSGSSIGREFFKVAPVPFVSPVPFLIIAPGPVHFPVPLVLISPGPVHFPVLLAKFGNKRRMFGNLINSMHHN